MFKKSLLLAVIISQLAISCSSNENSESFDEKPNRVPNEEMFLCTTDLQNRFLDYPTTNNTTSKLESVIPKGDIWKTGQTIRIKFLDGNIVDQEMIKKFALEWSTYANLNFEFVPTSENADIRIAIIQGTGAWSEIGKTSTASPYQNRPTMRLGEVSKSYNEASAKHAILHEFGHALGLGHETTNPANNIQWKYPDVYQYFAGQFTKEETDLFVINKQNPSITNYSQYDPLSVMHYVIPAYITLNKVGVGHSSDLSEIDKRFIEKKYPRITKLNLYPGDRLDHNSKLSSLNGNYSLFVESSALKLYNYKDCIQEGKFNANIKFSNLTSTKLYLEINGNKLLLFKGSVPRTLFEHPNPLFTIDYITLSDSGKINIISNGVLRASITMEK